MTPAATLVEPGTIRLERLLPGPIELVWEYLTDARKRAKWFCGGEFDLRPGGRARLAFDHDCISEEPTPERFQQKAHSVHECTITRVEAPRLLVFEWKFGGSDTEVTFELAPRGAKVLLVLTHRRVADRATLLGAMAGWDAHTGILADLLERRAPRPFWSTHAALEKEYAQAV